MNLTNSNIKQLVKNCNSTFTIQNGSFRIMPLSILDTSDRGTVSTFNLFTNSAVAQHKECHIAIYEKGNLVEISLGEHKVNVTLERKVEIEQLIIFALTEYMMYGIPPKWIITQSISGWTNAKVVFNQNGKHACIHTTVIKELMKHNLAEIINAKFSSNGSIIIDSKNYKRTDFNCGPSSMWWN